MGGYEGSGQIDHIHLKIQGRVVGADQRNPLQYMSPTDTALLADIAKSQEIEPEMGVYTDGIELRTLASPSNLPSIYTPLNPGNPRYFSP